MKCDLPTGDWHDLPQPVEHFYSTQFRHKNSQIKIVEL